MWLSQSDFNFTVQGNLGFGAYFKLILCLIDYCESNNRKCSIDLRHNGYSDLNTNIWDLVFEQPFGEISTSLIVSDIWEEIPAYRRFWKLETTSNTRLNYENINFIKKYKDLCKKYIIFNTDIQNKVNKLFYFYQDKKILGIHKRGRDHLTSGHAENQSDLIDDKFIKELINRYIDEYDYLYLTSDEHYWYNTLNQEYKSKFLFWDDKSELVDNTVGIHHLDINIDQKEKNLKDLITEILILSKCDKLLLMNSNVSHMALFFANHYDYQFYDHHLTYN
jgi:hypothetical protein